MSNTAENQGNDDDDLDDFFEEINKLTIGNHTSLEDEQPKKTSLSDGAKDAGGVSNTTPTKSSKNTLSNRKETLAKKELVERAETSRQSWQEFSIPQKSKQDRPLVSFAIAPKIKGKKKNSAKTAVTIETNKQEQTPLPPPVLLCQKPQWIAVLDTCVLLESFDDITTLISTAIHADSQLQRMPTSTVEPITVVIPYTVWTELDFRSKDPLDEDLRYRARRAVRMLNTELAKHGQQQQQQQQQTNNNATNMSIRMDAVIRSQSRAGLDAAARQFLSSDAPRTSEVPAPVATNNDDHILFCARAEQRQHLARNNSEAIMSGGVVLLTQDNVLTGKARADGVVVYTPRKFVDYYKRRAASLRNRTGSNNTQRRQAIA